MTRGIHRLASLKIKNETKPGFYSDGGGLYLQVSTFNASKSWVFKYTLHGRRRGMGMGPVDTVSLAQARRLAEKLREQVRNGIDPIEAKRAETKARKVALAEQDRRKTFKECAEIVIAQKADELRNKKAIAQWESTLKTYAYPILNDGRKIDELTRHDVAKALEPIWQSKRETASRLRGRIETVFTYAKNEESYQGDNPASLKFVQHALGRQKKESKKNQPALPHRHIGAFMAELRKHETISARALEFIILTAARSGEVRGATWNEIDTDNNIWIIPPSRMKANREHIVTLPDDAIKLLQALPRIAGVNLLFPAPNNGILSDMTLTQLLRRMHRSSVEAGGEGWIDARSGRIAVVHGFRSTFRDWYNDEGFKSGHTREAAEIALSHAVGNAVEKAYSRSDMREARRMLMEDWANYCGQVRADSVVPAIEV
ncbi:MAG: site-specific integrase [Nitrosomonadaceae bacterium]|nr:site-specific integrase [Nitrosomonadaceae bacterium]